MKVLISLPIVATFYLFGCAQTHEEPIAVSVSKAPSQKEVSGKAVLQSETLPQLASEGESLKIKEVAMTDEQKDFWVKKPGTLVYNSAHEITRSLRLQPSVTIYKEVEGWGLINPEKDEWVNMSDITETKPAGMLTRPQESNGMPKITVEEMLKDARK